MTGVRCAARISALVVCCLLFLAAPATAVASHGEKTANLSLRPSPAGHPTSSKTKHDGTKAPGRHHTTKGRLAAASVPATSSAATTPAPKTAPSTVAPTVSPQPVTSALAFTGLAPSTVVLLAVAGTLLVLGLALLASGRLPISAWCWRLLGR